MPLIIIGKQDKAVTDVMVGTAFIIQKINVKIAPGIPDHSSVSLV